MWLPFRKKVKEKPLIPPIVTKRRNTLIIRFSEPKGGVLKFWVDDEDGLINPWRDFYKWFYSRKNSNWYAFKHKDGLYTIKRDNIAEIDIRITTVQVTP